MKYLTYRVFYNQRQANGADQEFVAAHRVESWSNDYAFFANEDSPKAVSRLIPRDRVLSVILSEPRSRAQMVAEIRADLIQHGCSYTGRDEVERHGSDIYAIATEAGADRHGWVKEEDEPESVADHYGFYSTARLNRTQPLPRS
jgi:hypothetical protein